MTEDITARMIHVLQHPPGSEEVADFQDSLADNRSLRETWEDFVLEQFIAGGLTRDWRQYVHNLTEFEQKLAFHRGVQNDIRTLQDEMLRGEIRRIFPKGDIGVARPSTIRRFIVPAISIAAVFLLGVGVMLHRLFGGAGIAPEGVPVLMVEQFELEGVTEERLVNGIAQRMPAKLAAAEGIYPVTHFAVVNASNQMHILQATHTVRGKITRVGDQLQVEASLVDIEKNRELWNSLFATADDPKAFDDVQDRISLKIARSLQVAIPSATRARLSMEISYNAEAVNAFLVGERLFAERTMESLPKAMEMFQKASVHDPASAVIYGYLALAYDTYAENGWGDHTYWDRALEAANKALKIDPVNPEALVVLGDHQETILKDYVKAEEYFTKALRQQPGDAKIHQAIAELHLRTGVISAGLEHIKIARKIEPWHRVVRWVETKYLTATGRLEDALTAAEDLMQMHPDFPYIRNFYWQYHLSRGEHEQALEGIPIQASESSRNYMRAIVHVDRRDFDALAEVYPKLPGGIQSSIDLLLHVQKGEWDHVRIMLRAMLKNDQFGLIALFQTSDFAVFNQMKADMEIQQIFAEYGIRVHQIPDDPGPGI